MCGDDDDDLFHWARPTDPDTSHGAVPRDITAQCRKVLPAYLDGSELLDTEAYAKVGMVGHQRCSDLRRRGLIERTGKRLTEFGKPAYTCRITDAGRFFLGRKPCPKPCNAP